MTYTNIRTTATDWSIVNYYKIPDELRFTVTWEYGGAWIDTVPRTQVKQTACYAKVVRRRSDGSFFDFEVLDEEWVTIRGKHCKGIRNYIKIYYDLAGGL